MSAVMAAFSTTPWCVSMAPFGWPVVPYAGLPLFAAMAAIDQRTVAAARGLGTGPFGAFARIFLPLSLPGIVAAGVLVFILTLGFFVTPAILGGGKTIMIAECVSVQILQVVRRGIGSMLAVVLVAWVFLLPLLVVAPVSLTPERFLFLPEDELSLRHYVNFFTNEKWTDAIWQSLIIAVALTTIAVLTGTLAAIGLWRLASRFGEALRAFVQLPIIVPPIVSALAFFRVFVELGILDTMFGVILAHSVRAAPFVVITVSTSLASFDLRLEQAVRNLGATVGESLRLVILPNILPGVVSGAVFAFILSWDEIVVTLFVSKLNVFTLPRRMWDGIRDQADPTIAACATVLILLTVAGVVVRTIVVGRRERGA